MTQARTGMGRTGIGTVDCRRYASIGSEIDPRMSDGAARQHGGRKPVPAGCNVAPEAPLASSGSWTAGAAAADRRTTAYSGSGRQTPESDDHRIVLLVPMLAFDRRGYRLGYGGGFYDRTMARLRETSDILSVGLAFSGQVRDDLPVGPHDMRLDWIVTESAALRVSG